MQSDRDRAYYKRRVLEEFQAGRTAEDAATRNVHLELFRCYLDVLDGSRRPAASRD
jgi:hypothetical protein